MFYADMEAMMCKVCDFSCGKCTGGTANDCSECVPPRFLYKDPETYELRICTEDCPQGYYPDAE
jgi:hypothetical protein